MRHFKTHINVFKCDLCDMTVPSRFQLLMHIQYRHVKERPFKCHLCDKGFVARSDLKTHIGSHAKAVQKCDACDYTCRGMKTMQTHFRTKHSFAQPVRYGCHCCDKTYGAVNPLTKHLESVHGFKRPSGCSKFTYRLGNDFVYRLQTMRIESIEVSKKVMSTRKAKLKVVDADAIKVGEARLEEGQVKVEVQVGIKTEPDWNSSNGDVPAKERTEEEDEENRMTDQNVIEMMTELPQLEDVVEVEHAFVAVKPKRGQVPASTTMAAIGTTAGSSSCAGTASNIKVNVEEQETATAMTTTTTAAAASATKHKSIDNFMVMRKYITEPARKRIKITVADMDEQGNVTKKGTIEAEEINIIT